MADKQIKRSPIIQAIDNALKKQGYYASEELLYTTFLALINFGSGEINDEQSIFGLALEGPPGSGKSKFSKVYKNLLEEIWQEEIEIVEYSCDESTGKAEMYDEIDIGAALESDRENVKLPGVLAETIIKVQEHDKKIILLIDEYDKTKRPTDSLTYQFFQDGKIKTSQYRTLAIEPKKFSNVQVIVGSNGERDLSAPLLRRLRMHRLDDMDPTIFYKVAQTQLMGYHIEQIETNDISLSTIREIIKRCQSDRTVDEGPLNLVTMMYQLAHKMNSEMKGVITRLPAASELLIAIKDADRLIKYANAPQHIVYQTIINNLFKDPDDILTFEAKVKNMNADSLGTPNLKDLITEMKKTKTSDDEPEETVTDLISKTVFKEETKKMNEAIKAAQDAAQAKINEAAAFLEEFEKRSKIIEEGRKATIEEELRRLQMGEEEFEPLRNNPQADSVFNDETAFIKRGKDVYKSSHEEWVQVATALYPKTKTNLYLQKMLAIAEAGNITAFENGFIISQDGNFRLIMIKQSNVNNSGRDGLLFFVNSLVTPASSIKDILYALKELTSISADNEISFAFDTLLFNEMPIANYPSVGENVYKMEYTSTTHEDTVADAIKQLTDTFSWHLQHISPTHVKMAMDLSSQARNKSSEVPAHGVK